MEQIEQWMSAAANFVWGMPLLVLLMGGGTFFMLYSGFVPFRYFTHAINVLRGKYDDAQDPGEISHFQALMGHVAATVGMGNISGVAVAIATGGPGALFWMWVSAFVGMATKYFTCTLAIMYRGKDELGQLQGGPMYVIREGLSKKWHFLAVLFSVFGFFGATPIFQANQVIASLHQVILAPYAVDLTLSISLAIGLIIALLTALVILGGIKRIGKWASGLVPAMVAIYTISVLIILIGNATKIPTVFWQIISDAFTANAVMGGAVGSLIILGARRAAFSNEAGIGTAPMMHGAAKTKEAVHEGLVAMLGPAIDTLLICTLTGLAILSTDAWLDGSHNGILLTSHAFSIGLGPVGPYILALCVLIFAFTTIFGLSYYGRKCLSYLAGAEYGHYFNYWYISLILIGSISSLSVVVYFVDVAYGLMAVPTMISAILLAPKVKAETRRYFGTLKKSN